MEKIKNKRKNIVLILIAIYFISLFFSGWLNFRRGIYIGSKFFYKVDDTLYRNSKDNYISVERFDNRTEFTVFPGEEIQSAVMEWAGDKIRITYDDGTVVEGTWDGDWIYGEDGTPLGLYTDEIVADFDRDHFSIGKGALSDALCRIDQNKTETRTSGLILAIGGILYLIGALTYLFPNESYFFMSRRAFQKAELSGAAISMIAGIVITLGITDI